MSRSKISIRSLAVLIAIGVMLGSLGDADARRRTRQRARRTQSQRLLRSAQGQQQRTNTAATGVDAKRGLQQNLQTLIQQNGLKSFTKNGKMFFAKPGSTAKADYTKLGKNVVEFFVRPGFHHLYTRIGGDVYSRISGLSKSSYYPSSSQQIGVLVELKDAEMRKLQTFLDSARANPRQVIGPFVYAGGQPPRASNCTSYITYAKIGERGETLGKVCGTYPSGFPQGFLSSLMRSSSDRVKAIVVHNPKGEFKADYKLDLR
jgi:hypothetical protein